MLFDTIKEIQYYKTNVDRFTVTVNPPYEDDIEDGLVSSWTVSISYTRDPDYYNHVHDENGKEISVNPRERHTNCYFNGFKSQEEAFEYADKQVHFMIDTLPF